MTPKSKVRVDTRLNALAFADEPAVGGQRELPRPTPQNMYEGTPHPFLFSLNKEKDLICLTSQCPVQALVSFAPLAFKLFFAARHNAVLMLEKIV